MKFAASVLALFAVQSAAFTVQPAGKTSSALKSTPGYQYEVGGPQAPPQGGPVPIKRSNAEGKNLNDLWEESSPTTVQGGSLRTWSFDSPAVERVQVMMKTEGRPLNSNIDLWHGPDNTPQRMQIYIEDGSTRPFCAVIETPRGSNVVAVRNTGHLEFPMSSVVSVGDSVGNGAMTLNKKASEQGLLKTIQGGAIHTIPFAPEVGAVRVLLKTDGRPLNARIELLQGPNNNKQVIDLYTEDGLERPFYAVIETPGTGNVVRIVNTATVEFPLTASVEPFRFEEFDTNGFGRPDQDWNTPRNPF